MNNSTYLEIILYSMAITAVIVTPFFILDHFVFSKQRLKKRTAVNHRLLIDVRDSIKATLSRHPETPRNAKITGANRKTPIDFGHIYSHRFDLTFPIVTPTLNSYDTDSGSTTVSLATHATVTVTGTADHYFITVQDDVNHLVYSSKTGEVIERNPDRLPSQP